MADDPSNEAPSRSTANTILRWAGVSLTLLSLYVLSIGPAYQFLPGPWLPTVYRPLVQFESRCRPFDRFMTWYMEKVWKCGVW